MGKFHDYYEGQLNDYREQTLNMHKEAHKYKRSYMRMMDDFSSMKTQLADMAKRVKEIALLYKSKCQKLDVMQKKNNNLLSMIQTL
jgi:hypothetical protein